MSAIRCGGAISLVLVLGALATGCSSAGTSASVPLSVRAGNTAPTRLTISVFDERGALTLDYGLSVARLPGTFTVVLPDRDAAIRVAVVGENGLIGATRIQAHNGARVEAPPIELAAVGADSGHADADADGVADPIDDCPTVANHAQQDANGDGVGDACDGADLGVNGDGTSPDFSVPPSLCPGSFVLCDGFQGATVDTSLWPIALRNTTGGTMAIDASFGYRGGQSLKLTIDPAAASTYVNVELLETSAVPAVPLYMRAFVFIPSSMAQMTPTLMYASNATGPVSYYERTGLLGVNVNLPPTGTIDSSTSFAFGSWSCLEIGFEPDGGSGAIVSLYTTGSAPILTYGLTSKPTFTTLGLGFEFTLTQAFGGDSLWIDEVVVDNKRIGCTQ